MTAALYDDARPLISISEGISAGIYAAAGLVAFVALTAAIVLSGLHIGRPVGHVLVPLILNADDPRVTDPTQRREQEGYFGVGVILILLVIAFGSTLVMYDVDNVRFRFNLWNCLGALLQTVFTAEVALVVLSALAWTMGGRF